MQSLNRMAWGFIIILSVFGCKPPANKEPHSKNSLSARILLNHSGQSRLHECPSGFTGYEYCGQSHTYWKPAGSSPLHEIGDSLFSRIFLEDMVNDSTKLFLIENIPPFFDCEGCSPFVWGINYDSKANSIRWSGPLGSMGEQGKLPKDLKVILNRRNQPYLKHSWSGVHQGIVNSGIVYSPLFALADPIQIILEESNEGACGAEAQTCYGFKYTLKEQEILPDTLRLEGSGTRLSDKGNTMEVPDTLIPISR